MTKDPVLHTLGTRSFIPQLFWGDRKQGVSSVEHFLADAKPRVPSGELNTITACSLAFEISFEVDIKGEEVS